MACVICQSTLDLLNVGNCDKVVWMCEVCLLTLKYEKYLDLKKDEETSELDPANFTSFYVKHNGNGVITAKSGIITFSFSLYRDGGTIDFGNGFVITGINTAMQSRFVPTEEVPDLQPWTDLFEDVREDSIYQIESSLKDFSITVEV